MDLKEILKIPSVGKSIGEKIHEFLRTGTFEALEELRAQIPPGVREMIVDPGPRSEEGDRSCTGTSGSRTSSELAAGRRAGPPGRGQGVRRQDRGEHPPRHRAHAAVDAAGCSSPSRMDLADHFIERLGARDGRAPDRVRGLAPADGRDDRRPRPPGRERRRGRGHGGVHVGRRGRRVLASGETKSSILHAQGPAGRPPRRPARGVGRGDDLLHRLEGRTTSGSARWPCARVSSSTSTACSARSRASSSSRRPRRRSTRSSALPWIPPTLREDRGEVEAALEGTLPDVLVRKQLRGDLHTHTNLTDGLASLEQMLEAASELRYAYYAVTDHAPNLFMQRMTDEKMLAQREQLRALQSSLPEDDPAARHGAQHRRRGRRGLGAGVPRGVRRLRRVRPLASSTSRRTR